MLHFSFFFFLSPPAGHGRKLTLSEPGSAGRFPFFVFLFTEDSPGSLYYTLRSPPFNVESPKMTVVVNCHFETLFLCLVKMKKKATMIADVEHALLQKPEIFCIYLFFPKSLIND